MELPLNYPFLVWSILIIMKMIMRFQRIFNGYIKFNKMKENKNYREMKIKIANKLLKGR